MPTVEVFTFSGNQYHRVEGSRAGGGKARAPTLLRGGEVYSGKRGGANE